METENQGAQSSEPVAATPVTGHHVVTEAKGLLAQLEAFLDEHMVKKAPFQIPMNGKEILVKIAPYLVILGIIMAIPATLFALVLSPFALLAGGGMHIVGFLFSLAALVIEVIALPGLFKRTKASWHLLFLASVVSVVGSLVSFNLVGAVLGAIIGWYIIFQVKELYKN